jgi:hypothetical protein
LINYFKDADFNFWLHFFNKILPHSDILYSQLQQRQLDSMKLQKYISDFQNAIQKVRSEVDYMTIIKTIMMMPRFNQQNDNVI